MKIKQLFLFYLILNVNFLWAAEEDEDKSYKFDNNITEKKRIESMVREDRHYSHRDAINKQEEDQRAVKLDDILPEVKTEPKYSKNIGYYYEYKMPTQREDRTHSRDLETIDESFY